MGHSSGVPFLFQFNFISNLIVFNVGLNKLMCVYSDKKLYGIKRQYIITIIYLKSYIANKIKSDISRAFRGVVEMEGGAARL